MTTIRKYTLKVNDEIYYQSESLAESRRIAEAIVKKAKSESMSMKVFIEKQTITTTVVNSYDSILNNDTNLIVNDIF